MELSVQNLNRAKHGDQFRITADGMVNHTISIQENWNYNTIWWNGQCFTPEAYINQVVVFNERQMRLINPICNMIKG